MGKTKNNLKQIESVLKTKPKGKIEWRQGNYCGHNWYEYSYVTGKDRYPLNKSTAFALGRRGIQKKKVK